jgi:hypothetical protein
MKKSKIEIGSAYRIERENYGGNTGGAGALIVSGDTVNITVIGSKKRPSYDIDMVDLIEGSSFTNSPIVLAGMYSFLMLPEYIQVDGTADSVELINYVAVEDLGKLDSQPGN